MSVTVLEYGASALLPVVCVVVVVLTVSRRLSVPVRSLPESWDVSVVLAETLYVKGPRSSVPLPVLLLASVVVTLLL
jgi:hypothetical protein